MKEYLSAVVARLVPARNEASLAIIDGAARYRPATLSGFDISGNQQLIDRVIAETADGQTKIGTAVTDQGSLRYIAIPVVKIGDPQTGIYVRAIDLGAELSPVTAAITTYSIAAILVLAAIGFVGWFVAGRLLSPIRDLRDAADAITLDDMSPRLSPQGNDDISDLTRTVNSMLDRLEGSVDVQRQLLDDVRHELKTPITIVRGHLELMDPSDSADVAATREIGIAELDRMTRLVDDIDLLATVEGDAFSMVEVDLGALTARVGELVAVIPDHSWSVESVAEGHIEGDSDRLAAGVAPARRQRGQVHARGRRHPARQHAELVGRSAVGGRPGSGHSSRLPPSHLPPLRPCARQALGRRLRSGPCNRRCDREGPWRAVRRDRHPRRWRDVHDPPAPADRRAARTRARGRRRAAARGRRMTTILLIEDEPRIAAFVSRGLESAGYTHRHRRRRC